MSKLTKRPGVIGPAYVHADTFLIDLSDESIAAARAKVLARYPAAQFITEGEGEYRFGRIASGDVLVSLAFNLADPEAEKLSWLDGSQRLAQG